MFSLVFTRITCTRPVSTSESHGSSPLELSITLVEQKLEAAGTQYLQCDHNLSSQDVQDYCVVVRAEDLG